MAHPGQGPWGTAGDVRPPAAWVPAAGPVANPLNVDAPPGWAWGLSMM